MKNRVWIAAVILILGSLIVAAAHFAYITHRFFGVPRTLVQMLPYNREKEVFENRLCFKFNYNAHVGAVCDSNIDQDIIYYRELPLRYKIVYFCQYNHGRVSHTYMELIAPNLGGLYACLTQFERRAI